MTKKIIEFTQEYIDVIAAESGIVGSDEEIRDQVARKLAANADKVFSDIFGAEAKTLFNTGD